MMRILYCVLLILISAISFAQKAKPELVQDICRLQCSSQPTLMATYKDKLLFVANEIDNGMVRNVAFHTYSPSEGVIGPYTYGSNTVYYVLSYATLGDTVYFLGSLTINGKENFGLMKWDGTSAPQIIDKNLPTIMQDNYITTLNNKVYYAFVNSARPTKNELWEYDPNTGGNKMVAPFSEIELIRSIATIQDKIFISASTVANEYMIYAYEPKTGIVREIMRNTASPSLWKGGYAVIDNILYFLSGNYIEGAYLYKYDGVNPPVQLTSIPVAHNAFTKHIADGRNGKIYFTAPTVDGTLDLWSYDTQQDKLEQVTFSNDTKPIYSQRIVFYNGNIIYDMSYTGTPTGQGIHIYNIASDSNWRMPMPYDHSTIFFSSYSHVYNNELYLSATTDSLGRELFKYSEAPIDTFRATLYPNPTTGIAHLNTETNTSQVFTLTILDVLGHTITHQRLGIYPRGKHTIDIPLQHLASGVYICTLRGSKNILYRGKVVKL